MGVVCVTGGLRRSHDGAIGFVLECEERLVETDGKRREEIFAPVGKHRLRLLSVVGGISAVKGSLNAATI
eukprot:375093-Pyramimonas_sp.AAC.1